MRLPDWADQRGVGIEWYLEHQLVSRDFPGSDILTGGFAASTKDGPGQILAVRGPASNRIYRSGNWPATGRVMRATNNCCAWSAAADFKNNGIRLRIPDQNFAAF